MATVLVVEDEPLIRLTVIDALEDAGFHVIEAETADDALAVIENRHVHLLFTDVQMPGTLSGVDLAHAVAERFPDAGIIVSSGRLTPADLTLPASAEFFAKPYDFSIIIARLRALSNL
ncbi:response regulator [Neorhizobium sp. JUb45]|uniref:response regulator n=1 Tax=Neorhizobium sp. JUb45 TaxID=2485113 RepID=UPI0010455986|nr:response regulator [Neorhizobium sp. JUb45]TCQ96345.1 response regulator receiver domain-containing protein [Neorhizobium sp. JUb45]